ncbi:PTS transporter subunit EIIC [Paenibacillus xylanexedens]|uniref:PTS transporter subunit EIIC n=1 Tax=Paenibacillus xylanexedens TaxID=528191 RepID=UPI00119FCE93|nr:PTS transporter subunit EIIC [Paenibacillus xylanexedens]
MNHRQVVLDILQIAGGEDNIRGAEHELTAITLVLKDRTQADFSILSTKQFTANIRLEGERCRIELESESVALDVFNTLTGSYYVHKIEDGEQETKLEAKKSFSVLHFISDVFRPLLPVILGAGLIKVLLGIILLLNQLISDDPMLMDEPIFNLLSMIANTPVYLLPVLIAVSTAYRLRSNMYVAATLGGFMFYPEVTMWLNGEKTARLFGVEIISQPSLYSSVPWVILAVCAAAYLERRINRRVPRAFQGIAAAFMSLVILLPVILLILSIVGTFVDDYAGEWISSFVESAPVLAVMLIAAFFSLLMIAGVQYCLVPIIIYEITYAGYSIVLPTMYVAMFGHAGATLAVALRSRRGETKRTAVWSSVVALLGVPEPAIYAVNMSKRIAFYSALLGGGIGGLYMGLTSVSISVISGGFGSLFEIPLFIEEGSLNVLHACIGLAVSFVVAGALTYWLAGRMSKSVQH